MRVDPRRPRAALPSDVDAVQEVARRAGRRFARIADPRVARCADDPPPHEDALRAASADGRLWVVEDVEGGGVIGFLLTVDLAASVHVEEVDVLPERSGEGWGTRLLQVAHARAVDRRVPEVTLTTFDEVPFNRPWYERRGFRVLDEAQLSAELAAVRDAEASHGLDPAIRVVMACPARRAEDSTPRPEDP